MKITDSLRRGFALTATLTLLSAGAWAVPAKPGIHEYLQPDGSTVQVSIIGDEHFHCYETSDGHLLLPDPDGSLRYAVTDASGNVVASPVMASDPAARPADERTFADNIDRDAVRRAMTRLQTRNFKNVRAKSPQKIPTDIITNYPTHGQPKSMILLVEFQDIKFQTPDVRQTFQDMVSKPGYSANGATGCALDFFRDNSNGSFQPQLRSSAPSPSLILNRTTARLRQIPTTCSAG